MINVNLSGMHGCIEDSERLHNELYGYMEQICEKQREVFGDETPEEILYSIRKIRNLLDEMEALNKAASYICYRYTSAKRCMQQNIDGVMYFGEAPKLRKISFEQITKKMDGISFVHDTRGGPDDGI